MELFFLVGVSFWRKKKLRAGKYVSKKISCLLIWLEIYVLKFRPSRGLELNDCISQYSFHPSWNSWLRGPSVFFISFFFAISGKLVAWSGSSTESSGAFSPRLPVGCDPMTPRWENPKEGAIPGSLSLRGSVSERLRLCENQYSLTTYFCPLLRGIHDPHRASKTL